MNVIYYLLSASFGLFLFYISYFLFIRKRANFKQIRYFLVLSLLLSLLLPLIPIKLDISSINHSVSIKPFNLKSLEQISSKSVIYTKNDGLDIQQMTWIVYLFVSIMLLCRFFVSLGKVLAYIISSEKSRKGKYTFVFLDKNVAAFSFFNWIFIAKSQKYNCSSQIIEHEKVHAGQYHSFDIILSELMLAILWFNPLAWMYRSSISQIHEFLADEGVIESGANLLEYKSLLVNQAAEGKLITISSQFSYSLIKKRIIMMSEKKTNRKSCLKILLIIPVAALVLMSVSLQSNNSPVNTKEAKRVITNKTNADNSDAPQITKNEIIGQGELSLTLDGYDNSVAFRVVSFTVSTMIKNFEESYDQTNGPKFTRQQLDLIKRAQSGRKLYIENIKARGPEGEIRELGSIVFTIK